MQKNLELLKINKDGLDTNQDITHSQELSMNTETGWIHIADKLQKYLLEITLILIFLQLINLLKISLTTMQLKVVQMVNQMDYFIFQKKLHGLQQKKSLVLISINVVKKLKLGLQVLELIKQKLVLKKHGTIMMSTMTERLMPLVSPKA